jgi:alcohol dehydrogenase class IV
MAENINSFFFNTTPRIIYGSNVSEDSNPFSSKIGNSVLLITDKGITRLKLYENLITNLRKSGIAIHIFDDVEADPSLNTLEKAISFGKETDASGIIGFGGGSSMDVAKLTALILGSNENLEEAWGVGNAKGPRLPLILVPTTAGTGSEVTPVSIITVDGDEKRGVSSPLILPDFAILDPLLTVGLPASATAATGIDAMVHAIEAYASKNANNNPISSLFAKEALVLLGGSIRQSVLEPKNIEARGKMILGSMFAGMAFANSPVAAVHALAYPLGGSYHITHGLSNALVLPGVLKFNAVDPWAAKKYAQLTPFLFPNENLEKSDQTLTSIFIENLVNLSSDLKLPQKLRELDIPKDACSSMAKDAMKQTRLLVNNPRELNEKDAFDIYSSIW